MRALVSQSVGAQGLMLVDLPKPKPGPGQVLVRVRACGINYPDVLILEDRYQLRPQRPFVPGAEFSGEVTELGAGVCDLAVGDRVMAMTAVGGLAEWAVANAASCVRMPDIMPFRDGSAFLMTFGTAYHALKQRGGLVAGAQMLVLGAAGGVGLAAVQLGAALGAHVVAAASTETKVGVALSHGAHKGLVYSAGTDGVDTKLLAAQFKQAVSGGYDVIYDAVGGIYSEPALRAIAWNGRYLVIGFPAGVAQLPMNLPLLKGCAVVGVFYGAFAEREPAAAKENIDELLTLYCGAKITPAVSSIFRLSDGAEAIAMLSSRAAMGRVVVEID